MGFRGVEVEKRSDEKEEVQRTVFADDLNKAYESMSSSLTALNHQCIFECALELIGL